MPIIAAMLVISHMTSHKISLCSGGISVVHQSENNCYHIDIHPNITDEWKFWINKNNGNIENFGHKNNMDIDIYIYYRNHHPEKRTISGSWYAYPSEKYERQLG
jgi:hypothetical protein